MKCIKRPPTYEVEQYTGTEESLEAIRDLLWGHSHIEIERTTYGYSYGSADYITLFQWASGYYSEKKKEVTVQKGDYAVIREDGKYYSYTEEEFNDWMREAE